VVGQVAVVPDRVEEKLLLQEAETVVIGLAGTVDEVVLPDECTVGLEIGVVQPQDRRLRMSLDVVGGGVPSFTPAMLTQPLGPITSFTKKATSLIIGPQPASYQPTEPSANATWSCP